MNKKTLNKVVKIKNFILLFTFYLLLITFLIGCATVPVGPAAPPKDMAGIYHQVKRGQTLWRISEAYNVELEKIARINRLSDTSRIYAGQLLFIPDAKTTVEDLTLSTDFRDKGGDFIWPLKGKVSSYFGMKKDEVKNKGIYIQTTEGVSVVASRSGKVAFCSQELKGYGKAIIIDHLDGYSTVYCHNSKNLVKLNQLLKQGQVIAKAGSSGSATSPQVYFEIRKGHEPQNPFFYLP